MKKNIIKKTIKRGHAWIGIILTIKPKINSINDARFKISWNKYNLFFPNVTANVLSPRELSSSMSLISQNDVFMRSLINIIASTSKMPQEMLIE
jgi:hypothetical protein